MDPSRHRLPGCHPLKEQTALMKTLMIRKNFHHLSFRCLFQDYSYEALKVPNCAEIHDHPCRFFGWRNPYRVHSHSVGSSVVQNGWAWMKMKIPDQSRAPELLEG